MMELIRNWHKIIQTAKRFGMTPREMLHISISHSGLFVDLTGNLFYILDGEAITGLKSDIITPRHLAAYKNCNSNEQELQKEILSVYPLAIHCI